MLASFKEHFRRKYYIVSHTCSTAVNLKDNCSEYSSIVAGRRSNMGKGDSCPFPLVQGQGRCSFPCADLN